MKIFSLLATAALATAAALPNPFSPIPGYPLGIPFCLSDAQATFLVKLFYTTLQNPDKKAVTATMQNLLANSFTESSDSINIQENAPLGSTTFTSKEAYIASLAAAPPVPPFQTLDIFHDCSKISWRWNLPSLAGGPYPVKGINDFEVDPKSGQIKSNNLEFNSIAWASDIGWTCTPPPRS